jgi:hypothetical protein
MDNDDVSDALFDEKPDYEESESEARLEPDYDSPISPEIQTGGRKRKGSRKIKRKSRRSKKSKKSRRSKRSSKRSKKRSRRHRR